MYQIFSENGRTTEYAFNYPQKSFVTYPKHLCVGGPLDGQMRTVVDVKEAGYVLCSIPKWRRDVGDHQRVLVWLP